jgi:CRP/FNR family transcriptional regulator, carbon monoxide oxidation system transcription regulator
MLQPPLSHRLHHYANDQDRDTGAPGLLGLLEAPGGEELRAYFSPRRLARGEMLALPEQRSDQVFVVRSGRLRVYLASDDKELSIVYLERGDVFSTHTRAYVQAVEASEVLGTGVATFGRHLLAHPAVASQVIRVLARVLQNSLDVIENLAFLDVRARLLKFLRHQAAHRGIATGHGLLLDNRLNREEIACLLGTTRQTVSQLINELLRRGVLEQYGRGRFLIRDPQALRTWPADPVGEVSAG